MKIGVLISAKPGKDMLEEFKKVRDLNLQSCQISFWDMDMYNDATAEEINRARAETGIEISTLWAGYSGPVEWNFTYGPLTAGLVPEAYRGIREKELIMASDFALKIGVNQIATHVGFLPENYYDEGFRGTIAVLRRICKIMKEREQVFLFETGQETPVTVLRAIEEIGLDNVGINFDTANVIRYGKGNPADAVLVFGKYVRDTHIKDGFYPTDGRNLGKEAPIGEGHCDFPLILKRLKEVGYTGNFTIEREIRDGNHAQGIADARDMLLEIEKTL